MSVGRTLLYVANMRLPSEKAHSVHVMEMCAALAGEGRAIHLLIPDRASASGQDVFSYYGLDSALAERITIHRLFTIDLVGRGVTHPLGFYLQTCLFGWSVLWHARRFPGVPLVSRDLFSAFLLAAVGQLVAYEVHDLPRRWARWLLRQIPFIITTNAWKRDELVRVAGIQKERITVLPNAVDVVRFRTTVPTNIRAELGIPAGAPLVVYAGHLFAWKGVDTLVRAARFFRTPTGNAHIVVVGGTDDDRGRLAEVVQAEAVGDIVHLVSHRPHAEIPGVLAAADVLVLPTSGRPGLGVHETSPIKAFEYLAAGKPIVAADLPSSHDVLVNETALFFRPDDPADCGRAIKEALALSLEKRLAMMERQRAAVAASTWQSRAQKILALLEFA